VAPLLHAHQTVQARWDSFADLSHPARTLEP